ncbi:MAG: CBS domain-containing protein [Firmicutes bacterium]|nr:CBS domain-containing protein [Bacillota bacterium]
MTNLFLQQMSIKSLANPDYPRLVAECSLASAVSYFQRTRELLVAVVDVNNRLLGVLNSNDLLGVVYSWICELIPIVDGAQRKERQIETEALTFNPILEMPIRDMVREPQLIVSEEAASLSLGMLLEQGVQEVLVVDSENRFVGALVLNDVTNAVWKEIANLPEIFGKVLESVYNGGSGGVPGCDRVGEHLRGIEQYQKA